jgi:hypothetical protein
MAECFSKRIQASSTHDFEPLCEPLCEQSLDVQTSGQPSQNLIARYPILRSYLSASIAPYFFSVQRKDPPGAEPVNRKADE